MTTPSPIEKAVSKEVARSSPSWIRRDWVVVGVFFILLSVLSTVQVISLRGIEESVENSDVLAECFTPGTRCSDFTKEAEEKRQARLAAQNLCLLVSLIDFPPLETRQAIREELLRRYQDCVAAETPKQQDGGG